MDAPPNESMPRFEVVEAFLYWEVPIAIVIAFVHARLINIDQVKGFRDPQLCCESRSLDFISLGIPFCLDINGKKVNGHFSFKQ
jgi:hypothetical protein